jgi:hypothetical protein
MREKKNLNLLFFVGKETLNWLPKNKRNFEIVCWLCIPIMVSNYHSLGR